MACVRCGREIVTDAAYCEHCGADQRAGAGSVAGKRFLRRSLVDRQIAGVCGGIAHYFDIDPVFVRVAWVVLTIVPGAIFFLGSARVPGCLVDHPRSGARVGIDDDQCGDRWLP